MNDNHKVPRPIDTLVSALLQASTRQGIVRGMPVSPGVIVMAATDVRDIILKMLPHLYTDKSASDASQDTNITFGMTPEGKPYISHTKTDTGEVTVTHIAPDMAIQIGINMLQFGTLASIGYTPPKPPPEPTNDTPRSVQ